MEERKKQARSNKQTRHVQLLAAGCRLRGTAAHIFFCIWATYTCTGSCATLPAAAREKQYVSGRKVNNLQAIGPDAFISVNCLKNCGMDLKRAWLPSLLSSLLSCATYVIIICGYCTTSPQERASYCLSDRLHQFRTQNTDVKPSFPDRVSCPTHCVIIAAWGLSC